MDDRTSASNLTVSSSEQSAYRGGSPLRLRFPTIAYLRACPPPHPALCL
jgi:hypothetical protein